MSDNLHPHFRGIINQIAPSLPQEDPSIFDDDRLTEYREIDHEDRAVRQDEANDRSEYNDTGSSYDDDQEEEIDE
jgi:hypothetical protein